ncbi:MAG: 5-methyltetrahydropteroyltriglutamate--homocysteine S-methyltransferase [Pseudohongiella sp.]|uniref:5-methyltetrahydropteroyltriglutamate-- homocysteine S-methyltransferase n=1 Tax=Pseudohongiella sp. TaxID=1979412 RepID=UPI00349FE44B
MSKQIQTHSLGFPRIGGDRELKKALEAYWRGDLKQSGLEDIGRQLRRQHWQLQADANLDLIPCGDFAWYDQVLTLSATVGNIPARHRNQDGRATDLDTLFRVARGRAPTGAPASASDMTKWFDTNYHYIVPEFSPQQTFALEWRQIIDETREAVALGHAAKPVLVGPVTYLWLGKGTSPDFDRLTLLPALLKAYQALLRALSDAGAQWVQIDEPILSLDLSAKWQRAFDKAYNQLQSCPVKILLANYFGGFEENLQTALNLPVAGIHIDAVRAPTEIQPILDWLPQNKVLSVGIIDGRNVWRNNLRQSLLALESAQDKLGERLWLAPSCSLLHVPVDLVTETSLPPALHDWLAFATQKLHELSTLNSLLRADDHPGAQAALDNSDRIVRLRRNSDLRHNPDVQARLRNIQTTDGQRDSLFPVRYQAQQQILQLPTFPTTTIGSFPQTPAIRQARQQFKAGQLAPDAYQLRMRTEIAEAIQRQESLDIDVLVHGEAERNDMVEYFGEQLDGYLFTQYGWVQSYGSRCVKPPIIYGDIRRRQAMTVDWISYAQSLTQKPVKGMLTGPITMLSWSFVRDDQPRETTAMQIALALRDEVRDLESAGVHVIQVDEPAIREGLPLRKAQRQRYLDWAVKAFRLTTCCVRDDTQIHTHMCYSDFNDIIDAIAALDADVITIETSRSNGDLLQAFEDYRYPNAIGPGVYDIHSPNAPEYDAMMDIMHRAVTRIPPERLWVNPDCGLKTRSWPETEVALRGMVAVARSLRQQYLPD